MVHALHRNAQSKVTFSSPLEAPKTNTLNIAFVAVDGGQSASFVTSMDSDLPTMVGELHSKIELQNDMLTDLATKVPLTVNPAFQTLGPKLEARSPKPFPGAAPFPRHGSQGAPIPNPP
eukprot:CAMPEP_0180373882 /NCGR_PEP_ID=MMETSP0989-20121125/21621_1 /TAXON_ID=697907 /ORGANISM="non described non described, Strain CCMP2293" /LENGTH=118 /DNA_ID=CAMNT_0022371065 /DNA_START=11 /DNA_END=367 /DNA_ORIENTATION=-